MSFAGALSLLRAVNRAVAFLAGGAVLLTAAFILTDVTLRQMNASFGGTDEISGYVMAGVTVWGFSFALLERAHVRIDLIRGRLPVSLRVFLDLFSLTALAAVALVIAFRAWPVLEKSIANQSRANTVLETPLWIPQSIWFAGLIWFALMASVLTLLAVAMILSSQRDAAEDAIAPPTEAL